MMNLVLSVNGERELRPDRRVVGVGSLAEGLNQGQYRRPVSRRVPLNGPKQQGRTFFIEKIPA
jgi:hypothetical protein